MLYLHLETQNNIILQVGLHTQKMDLPRWTKLLVVCWFPLFEMVSNSFLVMHLVVIRFWMSPKWNFPSRTWEFYHFARERYKFHLSLFSPVYFFSYTWPLNGIAFFAFIRVHSTLSILLRYRNSFFYASRRKCLRLRLGCELIRVKSFHFRP